MAHEVVWTKKITDFFIEHGNLTEFQKNVLLTRISGMTQVQQSFYFSCSVKTIANCIRTLKDIYDVVQKEYPDILKPRRRSTVEDYLDEN